MIEWPCAHILNEWHEENRVTLKMHWPKCTSLIVCLDFFFSFLFVFIITWHCTEIVRCAGLCFIALTLRFIEPIQQYFYCDSINCTKVDFCPSRLIQIHLIVSMQLNQVVNLIAFIFFRSFFATSFAS